MVHLIDKSALVAEINQRIKDYKSYKIDGSYYDGLIFALEDLRDDFIDTLEVKEVDLEKEITIAMPHRYSWSGDGSTMLYTEEQMKDFAKHFFELGLKVAQKGE